MKRYVIALLGVLLLCAVMATADKWRAAPQPSYDFYNRNCVTFIRDIAVSAGLSVSYATKFIHDPQAFLKDVAVRNADFLADHTVPPAPLAAGSQLQPG